MAKTRSLLPPEQGVYAQLAFPLVTGVFLRWPTASTVALAGAALALFLAYEPVAILTGFRGERRKSQDGVRALRRGGLLLGLGALLGALGATGLADRALQGLLPPLAPLALLVPMILARRQKTLLGEVLVITALAGLVFPLGFSSQAEPFRILAAAGVWWLSLGLGTLAVHAIKAGHKPGRPGRWTVWGSAVGSGVVLALSLVLVAVGGPAYRGPSLALIPPAATVQFLAWRRVHPKHLKKVGWSLVGANTLTLIILLASG